MAKCIECGYLAIRDEYDNSVCEATKFSRDKGRHQSSIGKNTAAKFFCYQGNPNFCITEMPPAQNRTMLDPPDEEVIEVLRQEIECDSCCNYRQGKSPKEHEEMSFVGQVKFEAAKGLAEQTERNRRWREEDIQRHVNEIEWKKGVEASINARFERSEQSKESLHARTLLFQFLFSLLAAVIALIAAKLLPFINL